MSLILIFVFLVEVGLGLGAFALGIAACTWGAKKPNFLWPCIATATASALLQYTVATEFFQAPISDWAHVVWDTMFGWHLLPPFILAALLAFPAHRAARGHLMGITAGLLFSVTAFIVLAWPLALLRNHGSLPFLLH